MVRRIVVALQWRARKVTCLWLGEQCVLERGDGERKGVSKSGWCRRELKGKIHAGN